MGPLHEQTLIILATVVGASSASAQSIVIAREAANRCFFSQALEFLDRAPASETKSVEGLLFRARVLTQLERGREAIQALNQIPQTQGKSLERDRIFALGFALSADRQLPEAEAKFEEARRLGEDESLVEGALAVLRIQAQDIDAAEVILRRLLRREPTLSGALYNLACVMALRGEIAEAAALLRQAWHAGFEDVFQLKKDPMLERVRSTPGLIDDLLATKRARCRTY